MGVNYHWPGATIPVPGLEDACVYVPPFELGAGKVVVITADSGIGKSFFVSLLSGNANISAVSGKPERRSFLRALQLPERVIVVPQSPVLRTDLSVEQEVTLTWQAQLSTVSNWKGGSAAEDRFKLLCEWLDLTKQREKQINKLSGGQLKRVGILIRLAETAPVIILDEPDSGVNEETALKMLQGLFDHLGNEAAFLVLTHQPEIVKQVARHWQIVQMKPAKSKLDQAAKVDEYNATTVDDYNVAMARFPNPLNRPVATRLAGLPRSLAAAALLSLEPLFPKFSDVILNVCVAMGVYALVAIGMDVMGSNEAMQRFPKHAFFAIIASTWMGLQFAVHQTMSVWESWRADSVWRAGLRGVRSGQDAPLTGGVFLCSLLNSTSLGCGLRTLCGVATFVLLGCWNGWINHQQFPVETSLDVTVTCMLSALYGTAWGIFLACALGAIDTRVFRRQPKQFLLQLVVPMVLLAHLIFSARFLNLTDSPDHYDVTKAPLRHWTDLVAKLLPTNQLAAITERYDLKTTASQLLHNPSACLPILFAMVVLVLAGAWPAATALMSGKDIREK